MIVAMLQVVVIDCWPGATCCIVVQLPPLSNEYETFTKLAATWVQLMVWFWPTGKFWLLCLQVSESFRLGTRLNNPVVPLTSYQAGTPLLTLAPMDKLIFKGTVDEIDVGKLSEGMPVDLKIGALPSEKLTGKLSKISPKAKKQDNTTLFDLEVEITEAGSKALRAGYSANAEIIITKKDSILVIPERLVSFMADTARVEVQDSATGKIDFKNVKTGLSDGLNIEVTEGLALGQKVVERPPKEIK